MSGDIGIPASELRKALSGAGLKLHVRTVQGMTTDGTFGAELTVEARCPSGLALGGGFKIFNGKDEDGHYAAPPNGIVIEINRPLLADDDQTPIGWRVMGRVDRSTGTPWNLQARVICAEAEVAK
jgi:hypothetical protein